MTCTHRHLWWSLPGYVLFSQTLGVQPASWHAKSSKTTLFSVVFLTLWVVTGNWCAHETVIRHGHRRSSRPIFPKMLCYKMPHGTTSCNGSELDSLLFNRNQQMQYLAQLKQSKASGFWSEDFLVPKGGVLLRALCFPADWASRQFSQISQQHPHFTGPKCVPLTFSPFLGDGPHSLFLRPFPYIPVAFTPVLVSSLIGLA